MNVQRSTAARRGQIGIIGAAALCGVILPAAGLGATPALATPSCSVSAGTVTCTFSTPGADTFPVPAGVTSLTVTADGAPGAGTTTSDGGLGGEAQATLTGSGLTSSTLNVYVGMPGSLGSGGQNSGGNGGAGMAAGGGGGSASTVAIGSSVLVAGGGGGGGAAASNGGNGGTSANTTGADGAPGYGVAVPGGQGGTTSAGGAGGTTGGAGDCSSATAGVALAGGNGATGGETCVGGGGGGGGYYGGGGGGNLALVAGGGGGGSAFPAAATTISSIVVTPNTSDSNTNSGDGQVTISYPQIGAATTTTLSSSQNPSQPNQAVTFTATVSPTDGGGTVAFTNTTNSTTLCISAGLALVSASTYQATCTVTSQPVGSNDISAVYSGDAGYSTSTGTLTQVVSQVTRKLHTDLSATIYFNSGQTFTVTATLTSLGTPVAGQPVSFYTGSHLLCTDTTSKHGVASCRLTGSRTLLVEENSFTITAGFPGSTGYYSSFATAHISMFP